MQKTSGADISGTTEAPGALQWTRAGLVRVPWGAYDTFESLVFNADLRATIQKLALGLLGSQELCAKAKLSWRRGAFLFGPPGCGKTAATKGMALMLGWSHLSIPACELFDFRMLAHALSHVNKSLPAVVVLENVDEVFKHIDAKDFFDLFDSVSERLDGVFWIATTRHPEEAPKGQLIRPGRFEESIRIGYPTAEAKVKFYETYIEPFMGDLGPAKPEHLALLEQNFQLTYAHLQEMRLLVTKVLMDGEPDKLIQEFQVFCAEQTIGGDRWGGKAATAAEIADRVKLADPRMLLSALQVTDAFKRVVELTVSSILPNGTAQSDSASSAD